MTHTNPPIVITGSAAITCLGATRDETWRNVLAGKCGIGPLTELESPAPEGKGGGQAVPLPADYEPTLPREARYLRRTITDALTDAGVSSDSLPYPVARCGILLGTTLHGMREGGKFLRTGDFAHLQDFPANAVLSRAAANLPFAGLAATTCSACSSSLGAIALAVTLLETGQLDLVIAGGYDPISDYAYGGFNSLRLVAQGPLRPFARDREGMKVSEGYGIVVLERAAAAAHRGRTPLARVLGYGESADAHHLTQPHPEGDGAARAITAALKSANVSPSDIDLIAAHATGTPDNDAGEYAAFSRTFAAELPRVPVVAFKSHLGHTLGGAGAIELILSALSLRDQLIPACSENVKPGESDFPHLNLSTIPSRRARIRATLNTSLGFGGANTCIILAPPTPQAEPDRPRSIPSPIPQSPIPNPQSRDVFITGIGIALPGAVGPDALRHRLHSQANPSWEKDAGPIPESDYLHLLNARRIRRMSDYVKLTLAATAMAVQDAAISDPAAFAETCSAILGSAHGSSTYCHQYYGDIVKQGLIGANPMLFAEGVPNAAAAHLSLMLSLKGACQTLIGSRTSGLDALRLAALRIASGHWDRAIVSAGEEYYPTVNATYHHCGLYANGNGGAAPFAAETGFATGAGAVTLILESRASLESRNATRTLGRIESTASARSMKGEVADRTRDLLLSLGRPTAVLSSANATWLDATELAGIRAAANATAPTTVSAIYGHTAECFSAMPLAAIAATLLTGTLPPLLSNALPADAANVRPATGREPADSFAAISTDYTGLISGVRIARTVPR